MAINNKSKVSRETLALAKIGNAIVQRMGEDKSSQFSLEVPSGPRTFFTSGPFARYPQNVVEGDSATGYSSRIAGWPVATPDTTLHPKLTAYPVIPSTVASPNAGFRFLPVAELAVTSLQNLDVQVANMSSVATIAGAPAGSDIAISTGTPVTLNGLGVAGSGATPFVLVELSVSTFSSLPDVTVAISASTTSGSFTNSYPVYLRDFGRAALVFAAVQKPTNSGNYFLESFLYSGSCTVTITGLPSGAQAVFRPLTYQDAEGRSMLELVYQAIDRIAPVALR